MARTRVPTGMEWPTLAMESWWLAAESSSVIWMRCARLAEGGSDGNREALRMVTEKWQAQTEIAVALATGRFGMEPHGIATKAVDHYRRKVQANRKRLSGKG